MWKLVQLGADYFMFTQSSGRLFKLIILLVWKGPFKWRPRLIRTLGRLPLQGVKGGRVNESKVLFYLAFSIVSYWLETFTWVRARAGGRGWLGWKCDTLASYQSHFLSTYNCDCCHFMSLALKTKQICLPVRFFVRESSTKLRGSCIAMETSLFSVTC